jgi:hypothetical protein
MGTWVPPTMVNIFMTVIDTLIQACAVTENFNYIYFYKRFIDDRWTGTKDQLKLHMLKINELHDWIKFTCDYNIVNESTTYLDTTIDLLNNENNTFTGNQRIESNICYPILVIQIIYLRMYLTH